MRRLSKSFAASPAAPLQRRQKNLNLVVKFIVFFRFAVMSIKRGFETFAAKESLPVFSRRSRNVKSMTNLSQGSTGPITASEIPARVAMLDVSRESHDAVAIVQSVGTNRRIDGGHVTGYFHAMM